MGTVILVSILIVIGGGGESYYLWKRQLKREMVVSLAIWILAAAYAVLAVTPLGDQFTLSRFLIDTLDFFYGLFS